MTKTAFEWFIFKMTCTEIIVKNRKKIRNYNGKSKCLSENFNTCNNSHTLAYTHKRRKKQTFITNKL